MHVVQCRLYAYPSMQQCKHRQFVKEVCSDSTTHTVTGALHGADVGNPGMQWAYGSRNDSRHSLQQYEADPASTKHVASLHGAQEHSRPPNTTSPNTTQPASHAELPVAASNGPAGPGPGVPPGDSLHGTPHCMGQSTAGMSMLVSPRHADDNRPAELPTPQPLPAAAIQQQDHQHHHQDDLNKQEQQQRQIQELQHKVHVLTQQLTEALASRHGLVKGGQDAQSLSSPGISTGNLTSRGAHVHAPFDTDALERLQLKLQKAERALEHERKHSEALQQQVEDLQARQQEAAQQHAAASTIPMLQAELVAARSYGEQRTREAAALQRAVVLGDETVGRLRGQLAGLLEANKEAMAREQEFERQVTELRSQLAAFEQQVASQQQQLSAQQQQLDMQELQHKQELAQQQARLTQQLAAVHDQGSNEDRSWQVQLQSDNQDLRASVIHLEAALRDARAESARKDAGIRALEALLGQHSRMPSHAGAAPAPGEAPVAADVGQPGTPSASLPATVSIDMFMRGATTPRSTQGTGGGVEASGKAAAAAATLPLASSLRQPEASLPGGLSENQWKLVMLSEAVRGLRTTVMRLRHQRAQQQQEQRQAGAAHAMQAVVSMGGTEAQVLGDGGVVLEVVEVDLPMEEIQVRVEQLAAQMLVLEEELQQLRSSSSSTCDNQSGNAAVGSAAGLVNNVANTQQGADGEQPADRSGNGLQHGAHAAGFSQVPTLHVQQEQPQQQSMEMPNQQADKASASQAGMHSSNKPGRRRTWLFGWLFSTKEAASLNEV